MYYSFKYSETVLMHSKIRFRAIELFGPIEESLRNEIFIRKSNQVAIGLSIESIWVHLDFRVRFTFGHNLSSHIIKSFTFKSTSMIQLN